MIALTALLAFVAMVAVSTPEAQAGPGGLTVSAEPRNDFVGFNGFGGDPVTISFSGAGVDCDDWVTTDAGSAPCNIRPGMLVSATADGGTTVASVVVGDLEIGRSSGDVVHYNAVANDESVEFGCGGDVTISGPDGAFRWVPTPGVGQADFSVPGPCPEGEDDAVITLTEGAEIVMQMFDGDDDHTQDVLGVGSIDTQLTIDPQRGTIYGMGFMPLADATVTVTSVGDGPFGCGTTVLNTFQTTVDFRGEVKTRTGFTGTDDCTTVSDGVNEQTAFAHPIQSCTVDLASNEVTVTGAPTGPFGEVHAGAPRDPGSGTEFGSWPGDGSYTVDDGGSPHDFVFGGKSAIANMFHGFGPIQAICSASPAPVVDVELNPAETGYWILVENGEVAGVGPGTPLFDDTNTPVDGPSAPAPAVLTPGETAVSMSITPSGNGYWIFTSVGRVIARGDAVHHGDVVGLAIVLDQPAVDSVALADGSGYYIVAGDGGIFTFGAAVFFGSVPQILPGVTLDAPVVGLVPNLAGDGYWLIAADGGIFSFGNVAFKGSIPGVLPGVTLAAPVIGALASGDAYLMFATDGGIFTFGTSIFHGSLGANANPDLIRSVAVLADRSGYVMVDNNAVVVGFGAAFRLSSGYIQVS